MLEENCNLPAEMLAGTKAGSIPLSCTRAPRLYRMGSAVLPAQADLSGWAVPRVQHRPRKAVSAVATLMSGVPESSSFSLYSENKGISMPSMALV